jgi:hypothetical protein
MEIKKVEFFAGLLKSELNTFLPTQHEVQKCEIILMWFIHEECL